MKNNVKFTIYWIALLCATLNAQAQTSAPPPATAGTPLAVGDLQLVYREGVFLPAEKFSNARNSENPELYGVFPYRIHGVGKPDLEVARTTYTLRNRKNAFCWYQDQVQAALLGLTEEVKEGVCSRPAKKTTPADSLHSGMRATTGHPTWTMAVTCNLPCKP